MSRWREELRFIGTLMGVNIASAMEYRASFLIQVWGMFINNGIYLFFWWIFFQQFGTVRGYAGRDMVLLFCIVALSYGLAHTVAGNVGYHLAYLIAQGRLDYYLALPRALLPHVIFSRLQVSALGDLSFGLVVFWFAGYWHPVEIGLFFLTSLLAAGMFVTIGILAGSLAFFMGNAQQVSQQMVNATLTFSLYPNTLFSGMTRLILYTLLPAAFVGAVPVKIIQEWHVGWLLVMMGVVGFLALLSTAVFYLGVQRYESGSAINLNV